MGALLRVLLEKRSKCFWHHGSHGTILAAVALLFATDQSVSAQQGIAQWRLGGRPEVAIGDRRIELYRVRAAVTLSGGRIAIADAGNSRILIFSPNGAVITEIGKEGAGPGEFELISMLAAAHDSLVVYDAALSRVSVWSARGTLVRTMNLPRVGDHRINVVAMLSPSEFLATTHVHTTQEGSGSYRERVALLRVIGTTGRTQHVREFDLRRQVLHVQPRGATTTYSPPFLGSALVSASRGKGVMVPLDSTVLEVLGPASDRTRSVPIPVARRRFDRKLVDAYRDSILATANFERFPNAPAQLRKVYGSDFPAPRFTPPLQRIQSIGSHVWLQAFVLPGDTSAVWYVVDPERARVVARVDLPRDWQLLGGDDHLVLVLRRDEMDVEHVLAHRIERE